MAYLICACVIWSLEKMISYSPLEPVTEWIHVGELILLGAVISRIRIRGNGWYWLLVLGVIWVFTTSAIQSPKILTRTEASLTKAVRYDLLCPAVAVLLTKGELKRLLRIFAAVWTVIYAGLSIAGLYCVATGTVVYEFGQKYALGIKEHWEAYVGLTLWDTSTNMTAGHLCAAMMVAMAGIALTKNKAGKTLFGLAMIPMFFALAMTGSRSGELSSFFGFGVAAASVLLIPLRKKVNHAVLRAALCLLLIAVMTVAGLFAYRGAQILMNRTMSARAELFLSAARAEEAGEAPAASEEPTAEPAPESLTVRDDSPTAIRVRSFFQTDFLGGRQYIWGAAFEALGKKPSILLAGTSIPLWKTEMQSLSNFPWASHLHNIYLQILVETGIPGLVMALIFVFFVLRAVFRLFRDTDRPLWERWIILPVVPILLIENVEAMTRLGSRGYLAPLLMLFAGAAIVLSGKEKQTD